MRFFLPAKHNKASNTIYKAVHNRFRAASWILPPSRLQSRVRDRWEVGIGQETFSCTFYCLGTAQRVGKREEKPGYIPARSALLIYERSQTNWVATDFPEDYPKSVYLRNTRMVCHCNPVDHIFPAQSLPPAWHYLDQKNKTPPKLKKNAKVFSCSWTKRKAIGQEEIRGCPGVLQEK